MLADSPVAYRGEPGSEFLKVVPTTWDETRVLDGRIGEYVVIARRHGSDWYVGAITDAPAQAHDPARLPRPGQLRRDRLGRHARVGAGTDEDRHHAEEAGGRRPDRHPHARPRAGRWRGDPDPTRPLRRQPRRASRSLFATAPGARAPRALALAALPTLAARTRGLGSTVVLAAALSSMLRRSAPRGSIMGHPPQDLQRDVVRRRAARGEGWREHSVPPTARQASAARRSTSPSAHGGPAGDGRGGPRGPVATSAARTAEPVLLRRAGQRPVRADHRAAGVLPDANRDTLCCNRTRARSSTRCRRASSSSSARAPAARRACCSRPCSSRGLLERVALLEIAEPYLRRSVAALVDGLPRGGGLGNRGRLRARPRRARSRRQPAAAAAGRHHRQPAPAADAGLPARGRARAAARRRVPGGRRPGQGPGSARGGVRRCRGRDRRLQPQHPAGGERPARRDFDPPTSTTSPSTTASSSGSRCGCARAVRCRRGCRGRRRAAARSGRRDPDGDLVQVHARVLRQRACAARGSSCSAGSAIRRSSSPWRCWAADDERPSPEALALRRCGRLDSDPTACSRS